ncbi:hypothetical protein [Chryseolinea lacunae]|uniref:Uncharacterized protein n=1 Tax=Chryseolinea lacunae TaxID=2801331 RepID=A0ABS1KX96_9BACT|nr:hypothetical protein [Chryseolinea lacunae]MBL0743918.1 hypothetical protein [Chryseolinea lacunae]
MGLDMRPMGKPKPGFEVRFNQIFKIIGGQEPLPPGTNKDDLLQEWFANQIPTYETIKAPRVGRDPEADAWIKERYNETDKSIPEAEFMAEHEGFYVIDLAKETDGVPVYIAMGQDENVFRGQFMNDCVDLIGEELVAEAWQTKLADDALDYGNRLLQAADAIAREKNLLHLKDARMPPEGSENSIESQLHIVYSLARWLTFYGRNGHGYEADF